MAVFHIYISKDNSQVWEVGKHGDINLANFNRSVQMLIGFVYKLADDAVFEKKNRDGYSARKYGQHNQQVDQNFLKPFQKFKKWLGKNTNNHHTIAESLNLIDSAQRHIRWIRRAIIFMLVDFGFVWCNQSQPLFGKLCEILLLILMPNLKVDQPFLKNLSSPSLISGQVIATELMPTP